MVLRWSWLEFAPVRRWHMSGSSMKNACAAAFTLATIMVAGSEARAQENIPPMPFSMNDVVIVASA